MAGTFSEFRLLKRYAIRIPSRFGRSSDCGNRNLRRHDDGELVPPSSDPESGRLLHDMAWLGLIPFWWLCSATLSTGQLEHPAATYIGLLPFLLVMDVLLNLFQPGNPWLWLAFAATVLAYSAVARWVNRLLMNPVDQD